MNPPCLAPAGSAGHGQGLPTTCGACSHLRRAFVCHSRPCVSVRGAVREGLRARRLVLVLGGWTWPWKRVVRLPHERGTMMPSLRLLNQCVRGALCGGCCARDGPGVERRAGRPVLILKLQPGLLHATMACSIRAQQSALLLDGSHEQLPSASVARLGPYSGRAWPGGAGRAPRGRVLGAAWAHPSWRRMP